MANIIPATRNAEHTGLAGDQAREKTGDNVLPSGNHNAIEVRQVSKQFGAVQAVNGVDLSVRRGEMFGLIGHNGAGKSTLFKMMLGLLPVSAGTIHVDGVRTDASAFRDVRRRIGYVPENVVLYDNLSGLETVEFFARLKGVDRRTCGSVLERVGLSHAADRRVHGYSKGMRQRLGFAQALLGAPQLMFLDEPTSGLDPEAIRAFYRMLAELKAEGVTLILSSHILAEIQERVDRLAIMAGGQIRALGSLQSLRERVHLPLHLQVTLNGDSAPVIALLQAHALTHEQQAADRIVITCPRERKMDVLALISPLTTSVVNLDIQEPSLEDVFFGIAQ